jgi:hypothetical protein
MTCSSCGNEIPPERLEVLPHTKTCAACSTEQRRVGFLVYGHKTAGEVVMVDGGNREAVRQAERAYRRAR